MKKLLENILHELSCISAGLSKVLVQLQILNKRAKEIAEQLQQRETTPQSLRDSSPDKGGQEWLAQGIDNILGYQVGKKRSEGE